MAIQIDHRAITLDMTLDMRISVKDEEQQKCWNFNKNGIWENCRKITETMQN